MIEVTYNKTAFSVTVKGHAQSAPLGEDLVCAAATILARTLAEDVKHMSKDKKHYFVPTVKLEGGKARIRCRPHDERKAITEIAMDSVCVGFEILAHQFPDNIKYLVVR